MKLRRFIYLGLVSVALLFTGCSDNKVAIDDKKEEIIMDLGKTDSDELVLESSSDSVSEVLSVGDSSYQFSSDDSHLTNVSKILDTVYVSENIMISPLSLDFVLGMAANGADSETCSYYCNYFGEDLSSFNAFTKQYLDSLSEEVEVANGIFIRDKYTLKSDISDLLMTCYKNDICLLDFDSKSSVDYINNWCKESTHNMIPHVVDDVSDSEAILANALYFKDDWAEPVTDVVKSDFFNISGDVVSVDMMCFKTSSYLSNDKASGFIKYYENDRYGFVGILPTDSNLTVTEVDLDSLLASKSNEVVNVRMPEFSFDSKIMMTNALQSLGLDVFSNGVYDGFVDDSSFEFSDVLQVTKIDVNRNGTEAAAVTMGSMKNSAIGFNNEKYVNLNKPFIFMIYDFENDVPLFIGRISSM